MNHNRIIVASQPRCGSMWAWNVARDLIRAAGLKPLPATISPDAPPQNEIARALYGDLAADEVACIKVHRFVDPRTHDCLVIGPYRNLFDASLSMIRFQAVSPYRHTRSLSGAGGEHVGRFLHMYPGADIPNLLPIRYPDIVARPSRVVRQIAEFIGADLGESEIQRITAWWSRENVAARLVQASSPVPGQAHRTYDPVTGFSSNHFAPDKPLMLSNEEESQLRNAIRGVKARAANRERKEAHGLASTD